MKAAAVIVAGGLGKRFGSKTPKQFLPLCGKPAFLWSAEVFASLKVFKQIIVVVPKQFVTFTKNVLSSALSLRPPSRNLVIKGKIAGQARNDKTVPFAVTEGGKERFDSVKNGLELIASDIDYIAVHDAARPLINKHDILAVLKKAANGCSAKGCSTEGCSTEGCRGAIAVEKTKDTIKTAKGGYVLNTLDRNILYNVQTPQIFEASLLKKAYSKKIPTNTTDDSMLMENLGVKIAIVETKFPNFKITAKQDFELAKQILNARR